VDRSRASEIVRRRRQRNAVLGLTLGCVAFASFAACSTDYTSDGPGSSNTADGSLDQASTLDGGATPDASATLDAPAPTPTSYCGAIDATLCDDFERDPADAKGPWTKLVLDGPGSTFAIGDGGSEAGSVAIAHVTPSVGDAYLAVSFPAVMSMGDVSFDVLFRGIAGTTEITGFDLGDNGNYQGRHVFFQQDVQKTSLVAAFLDQKQSVEYVTPSDSTMALMENVWYRLRIHFEFTDGGADAVLFEDNSQLAEVKPSGAFGVGFPPSPPTIEIGIHSAQGDAGAGPVEVLVDNVVVVVTH
jgi:hypothetical protein